MDDLKMEKVKKLYFEWKISKIEALERLWKELRKLPWFKKL